MMSFGCHIVASGSSSLRVCKISTTVCGFSELCNHDIPTMTMTMITTIIPTWLLRTRSLSFQWSWELPTRAVCNWPARAQGLGGWNVDVACLRWMTLKISIGICIYTLDFSYLHIYYEYIYIYVYTHAHTLTICTHRQRQPWKRYGMKNKTCLVGEASTLYTIDSQLAEHNLKMQCTNGLDV